MLLDVGCAVLHPSSSSYRVLSLDVIWGDVSPSNFARFILQLPGASTSEVLALANRVALLSFPLKFQSFVSSLLARSYALALLPPGPSSYTASQTNPRTILYPLHEPETRHLGTSTSSWAALAGITASLYVSRSQGGNAGACT